MKEERIKKGLTQENLADLVNVSYDTIKRYEGGAMGMRLDVAYDIACALDVPFQVLLPQRKQDVKLVLENLQAAIPSLLEELSE